MKNEGTKEFPGEGFKRGWPQPIKTDEATWNPVNSLFANAGDKLKEKVQALVPRPLLNRDNQTKGLLCDSKCI